MPRHPRSPAFTLIELLVVISIIAILISILLPALGKARKSSENVQCRANLHQVYIGLAGYASDQKNAIPPNHTANNNWHYYVGKGGYFGSSTAAIPGNPSPYLGNTWALLRCPSEYSYPINGSYINYTDPFIQTSYAINYAFSYSMDTVGRRAFGDSAPGQQASKLPTIMDCEAWNPGWQSASFLWHVDDQYWSWDPFYPYRHSESANVLYMDGHVGGAKSFVRGDGPRVFWRVYDKMPDGSALTGGLVYEIYPY